MKTLTLFKAYVKVCARLIFRRIGKEGKGKQLLRQFEKLEAKIRERLDVPEEFTAWACPQCGWLWTSHNVDDEGTHTMTGWLDVTEIQPS